MFAVTEYNQTMAAFVLLFFHSQIARLPITKNPAGFTKHWWIRTALLAH